jgi:hypothetical protein
MFSPYAHVRLRALKSPARAALAAAPVLFAHVLVHAMWGKQMVSALMFIGAWMLRTSSGDRNTLLFYLRKAASLFCLCLLLSLAFLCPQYHVGCLFCLETF